MLIIGLGCIIISIVLSVYAVKLAIDFLRSAGVE
jgi:hypothetical protein